MSTAASHWVFRSKSERVALRLPVRALLALLLLALALLVISCVSLATGTYGVAFNEVIDTLRGLSISRAIDNVVWEFRFPRTLAAALVEAFRERNPGIAIEMGQGLGTGARLQALAEGRIDIALASHGLRLEDITRQGMSAHEIARTAEEGAWVEVAGTAPGMLPTQ